MKGVKSVRVLRSQLLESRVVLISPCCGSLPEDTGSHRESYNQELSGHHAEDMLNVPVNETGSVAAV